MLILFFFLSALHVGVAIVVSIAKTTDGENNSEMERVSSAHKLAFTFE